MAATKNMDLIASQILDLAPSCVEFVPPDGGDDCYFIVGTYNLQKENVLQKEAVEDSGSLPVSRYRCLSALMHSEYLKRSGTYLCQQNSKPQSRNGSLNLFKIAEGNL